MLEGVKVERGYWHEGRVVTYTISWRAMDGLRCQDRRAFAAEDIWLCVPGVVPMTTGILSRMRDGRVVAMAYLVVTESHEVVARIKRVPDMTRDEEFYLPGGLPESGPYVHPLPIIDRHEAETDP